MAVISANVQYNRGEHKLLDYTSLQNSYLTALDWTNDPNSNAAIGQYIYISNDWTDEETGKLYPKGPYIVESIKTIDASTKEVLTSGKLTPLSQSIAGEQDLSSVVADLKTTVGNAESGLVADVSVLKDAIDALPETFVTDVKDASGYSLVEDGVVTLGDYATKEDVSTGLAAKADASEVYTKGEADNKYVAKEDNKGLSTNDFTTELKTKLEEIKEIKSVGDNLNVDASGKLTVSIPEVEVPFQSVANNDKVLTLDNDGVLSSTLSYVRENYNGKDCLVLRGKTEDDILGAIEVADFVADGMLESVTPVEDTNEFLFTFKTGNGTTQEFKVDFSKYVDTYNADGVTLELGENNTFKVKDDVFVKADSYLPYIPADQNKLATIAEGAQVNTIESITLNGGTLAVDDSKNINIDLSAYALDASVDASLSLKANVADVYNSSTVDGLLGAKVDTSVYDSKVLEIDGSISTIKGELTNKVDTSTFESALGGKVDVSAGFSLVDDNLISKLDNMAYIKSVGGDLSLTDDGALSVDLSSYATIVDTSANFVQKEDNKGLSSNDFTTELKTRLEGIEAGAQVNVVKEVDTKGVLGLDATGKLSADLSDYALSATVDASLANKLDASAKVNGVSFDNGVVTIDAGDIKASEAFGTLKEGETTRDRYTTNDSVQSILSSLDSRIDSINTIFDETFEGVIVSVQGSNAIGVTTGTSPEISLKVSDASGNVVSVESNGVYVPDMRSYWEAI